MADDEAPAPCPTCGTPIEPEYAERLREQQAVRQQALKDIREAFDVWRLAPNTGDMNMALCAALSQTFNTLASAGVGTPVRPPLQCCIDGDHSFSWRQGIEPCRYCGAPVPVAAGTSEPVNLVQQLRAARGGPISIDDVPWLVKDFDVLYRVAKAAVQSAQSGVFITNELVALQVHLQRLVPALDQIEAVKAALREPWERLRKDGG